MEKELFDWAGWDGDAQQMMFYDTVLKVQIGEYPPGTKFDSASIGFISGELKFCDADGTEVATFNLKYRVEG